MRPRSALALLLVLSLGGCASDPDDTCVAERKLAVNRISLNKLATNKLATNGLLGDTLPAARLTTEALVDVLGEDGLADDMVQSVLEYAVGCALAPGQSLEVPHGNGTVTYEGALGLAPQWGEAGGSCDASCQGWVSACLIARTNFLGQSRPISLLGDHRGLAPSHDELAAFDVEEATYFGELFGAEKTMYACLPEGADGPERTCGDDPSTCAITVLGACDDVCDDAGCRGADGKVYAQRITVNLSESASCQ